MTATHPSPPPDPQAGLPPQMQLLQMILGNWVSQSIYAAAKLGIADVLKEGHQSCEAIARATDTHPGALYRLLRGLASVGIFAEIEAGQFTLTPLAQFLRSDAPDSVRAAALLMGGGEHYQAWGDIEHSIRTGKSAIDHLYGMNVFQYYAQNSERATVFDQAMTNFSQVEGAAVVDAYDFSGLKTVVDVAGGQGSLLSGVLHANPHLTGILFDVPSVIESAQDYLVAQGVQDRCQTVAGDFFQFAPAGGDAYLLKHIIHDWDDERSIAILNQCRQAMNPGGRVLVIEQVIPPGNEPFMGKLLDINMLVLCPGGKERTAAEYQALFEAAGLKLTRVIPTVAMVSVVEGVVA